MNSAEMEKQFHLWTVLDIRKGHGAVNEMKWSNTPRMQVGLSPLTAKMIEFSWFWNVGTPDLQIQESTEQSSN